jgi:hypothetical protein
VRATCQQTERLLAWAEPLGERTWAVESAGGMGYLLSQQLVGAGERVGPILACELIGYTGDVRRFTTRDQFASYAGFSIRTRRPENHLDVVARTLAK